MNKKDKQMKNKVKSQMANSTNCGSMSEKDCNMSCDTTSANQATNSCGDCKSKKNK